MAQPSPELKAWASLPAWVRFVGIATCGLALDLWTKWVAFKKLAGPRPHEVTVLPHVLYFSTTLNPGGVFGLGPGHPALFILVSLLALIFITYVFVFSNAAQRILHVALGLILAGALGNLYDRAFNGGQVRDFILLLPRFWPFDFNIADTMLCIGVPLLMLCWTFQKQPAEQPAEPVQQV